jgi:DNA gyrase/topoisomerase IV subunit B
MSSKKQTKKDNSEISDKYQKLEHKEHVLTRPGMYIGAIEEDTYDTWVMNRETNKMEKKQLKYIPGLFKIFDEILVNAIDHSVRLKSMKTTDDNVNLMKSIKVNINQQDGIIEVINDGDGIEVVEHPEHKIYIPELIFGNLLTSTNYDDTVERVIGGCNGLGSKAANIFSECFEVETVDRVRKLIYKQRFETNMSVVLKPSISKYSKKPYTSIKFKPDLAKFKIQSLSNEMMDMFVKRVYDVCAVTDNDISVYLNDTKLEYKNFEKYVDLYIGSKDEHTRVYEKISDRWEIVASYNDFNGFDQISFVNGVWTIRGGKHVEYILNQIVKKLSEMILKKNKNANIKPQNIRDNIILFVRSTIVNPSFDSQSKETLTTPVSKFGSKAEVSDKFIEKLYKTGIAEKVMEICEMNNNKDLKKTDGKKKSVIKGIPKLDDANWAGTNKSKECTLILTEGDSAKTMVLAGISQVGRDKYGVFPLKGKVMNVKDTNVKKITDNEEISNLKKILGLETGKEYKSVDDLRYGRIMLMCDADSVTFDTPCLVKHIETDKIDIKPICELYNDKWISIDISGKEYNICNDYLVWSDKGWTKIKHVMRHKVSKPIHRVLTHTGCVDVTEDHSLVTKAGDDITIKECTVKETELLHCKYIQEKTFETSINEEYAYALGYFMADGFCNIDGKVTLKRKDKEYHTFNSKWGVSCVEQEPLIKLKNIFEKYECTEEVKKTSTLVTKYQCNKCKKYFKKSSQLFCHQNIKSDCIKNNNKKIEFEIVKCKFSKDAYSKREFKYELQAKVVRKPLCEKYRRMFYNSLREKKVPYEILNSSQDVQQAFLNGFYAGDGNKGERTTDKIDGEYKSQIMGLFYLLQNCGYKPSLNCSSKKLYVYNVLMGKERGYWRPEYTIKKIFDVSSEYQDTYVYDFETENHHFHGSIGNIIVHNCDGLHIQSLVFNLFQTLWPSLFKTDNFITTLLTPIVKVSNNQDKKNTISFYCNSDYENWKKEQEENGTIKRWRVKYYKGLGTSTNEEAKQYFRDLKIVTYKYTKDESDFSIDLAFNKKKADERKEWLSNYNRKDALDYNCNEVKFEDFINKGLIHFSNYDIERSIPNLMDGLKISQRKILFACYKRNLVSDEIRVAQLASYVSEHACYHHGEASLQSAIIAMAQNFVGANNINLLKPNGQFGSVVQGGKDAGAPRYIYTLLEKITQVMFNKQDNGVLTYLNDDGIGVEPEYYVPVIPLILVNGAIGIGTGFSTNIPCYNPIDIIAIIKNLLTDTDIEFEELVPWYMGFGGTIESVNEKYVSRGCFRKLTSTKIEITELPVGTWTEDFKLLLEEMVDKDLKSYESQCTDKKVLFTLQFISSDVLDTYMSIASNGYTKLENDFKLVSSKNLGTTNMYLYNHKCQIQKYNTALDIILEFYQVRLSYYTKRKNYVIDQLEKDMEVMRNKIRFIRAVVSEEVKVSKLKKAELEMYLQTNDYLLVNDCYDYLLKIPIYNITKDKVSEIEDEYKKAEQSLNDIKAKTEKQMWLEELELFEKEYLKFKDEYYSKHNDIDIQETLTTKKSKAPKK